MRDQRLDSLVEVFGKRGSSMEWKNKRLLVAGMGKSGRSVMEAALALGARAAL